MSEEKLQAYALGELPPEEATAVAAAIAKDPALQERALRYRIIREGFRQQRVNKLQEELLAYDKTLAPPTSTAPAAAPPPRRAWFKTWWLLVILLLLALAGYWATRTESDPLPDLFYEAPYDPSVAGGQATEAALQEAEDLFFAEDYAAARERFEALLEEEEYRSTARFYLPHASFKLREYEAAAEQFRMALADDNNGEERRNLLRWNAMINRLARGEDVTADLQEDWPPRYRVNDLRKALENR